jgi:hypothetical protein
VFALLACLAAVGAGAFVAGVGATGAAALGSATHLAFLMQPSNTTAGTTFSVVVAVEDAQGNVVTSDNTDQVILALATGPSAVLNCGVSNETTVSGGVASFPNCVLKTSGTGYTLQASADALTPAGSNSFIVSPAALDHFALSGPASVPAGSPFSFTVTAEDQFGNVVISYMGTVGFASTDPAGTLPGFTAFVNGVHTFTNGATLRTLGSQTITAIDTSGIRGTFNTVVTRADTSTTLTSSPNPSVFGQAVTFLATVSPRSGTETPTGTLSFFQDGSTTAFAIETVNSSGSATITTSALTVGAHSINATYIPDTGSSFNGSASTTLTQQVAAYNVPLLYSQTKANNSGATVAVKLQLLNAAGTNLSAPGITVTVTGLSPSPAPGTAPTGTFTFMTLDQGPGYQLNVKTAGYPAGTYTLSFTVTGDPTPHTAKFVVG